MVDSLAREAPRRWSLPFESLRNRQREWSTSAEQNRFSAGCAKSACKGGGCGGENLVAGGLPEAKSCVGGVSIELDFESKYLFGDASEVEEL